MLDISSRIAFASRNQLRKDDSIGRHNSSNLDRSNSGNQRSLPMFKGCTIATVLRSKRSNREDSIRIPGANSRSDLPTIDSSRQQKAKLPAWRVGFTLSKKKRIIRPLNGNETGRSIAQRNSREAKTAKLFVDSFSDSEISLRNTSRKNGNNSLQAQNFKEVPNMNGFEIGLMSNLTIHQRDQTTSFFNYFNVDRMQAIIKSRSRDAVWASLSMIIIVGGLVIAVMYTKIWRTRHEIWIDKQNPLPPVNVSIKEVVLSRAKYLPMFRPVQWHNGKRYRPVSESSDNAHSSEDEDFVIIESPLKTSDDDNFAYQPVWTNRSLLVVDRS